MLKIQVPIELKSTKFSLDDSGFGERIRDNYSVMGAQLSEQSLTHMLHTPPQFLIAEGSESYTGIQNNIYSFNELSQTLINNVANRILLSSDVNLSYQDKVYISSILHKLGIRDERRFMEEARNILEESKNSQELTQIYLDNMPQLVELLENWEEIRERRGEAPVEVYNGEENNFLYMQIMNRLQSGAIYQILQNMIHSQTGARLSYDEINISEQSYTARQMLLKQFRSMAAGMETPLIYRADNVFEEETRQGEDESEERIREKINSAVFLELIRSFDHAMTLRSEREKKRWTDLRESFYRTADHSLSRILIEAREGRSPVLQKQTVIQLINETEKREVSMLREIFSGRELKLENFERVRETFAESTETETFESETLEQQLERVNRENMNNVERYREIRRILNESREKKERISDRERTLRESLKSLQDTSHIMTLLEESDDDRPDASERLMERIYELLPSDTVAILKEMQGEQAQSVSWPAAEAELSPARLAAEAAAQDRKEQEAAEAAALLERTITKEQERILIENGELPEGYETGPASERSFSEEELIYRQDQYTEESSEIRDYRQKTLELIRSILLDERSLEVVRSYEQFITREIQESEERIEERERIYRAVENPAETLYLLQRLTASGHTDADMVQAVEVSRGVRSLVSMTHRVEEQLTEEDVQELLEEYRRTHAAQEHITQESTVTQRNVQVQAPQRIENAIRPVEISYKEEIAEQIEKGIRRQLGTISNEVYNRLEKRLRSEKARRGI